MVKQLRLALLVLFLFSVASSYAKMRFELSPSAYRNFGSTDYVMDYKQQFRDTAGTLLTYGLKSELSFPLDAVMVGLVAQLASGREAKFPVSLRVELARSITHPGKKMEDHDWESLTGYSDLKTSFTESDVEMSMLLLNLEFTRLLAQFSKWNLSLLLGFHYEKIEQDIIGFEGWYLDSNLARQPVSGTEKGIVYEITYKRPQAGLLATYKVSSLLSFDLKSAVTAVFVTDFDDHLLRNKTGKSNLNGLGFLGRLRAHYLLSTRPAGRIPFVDLTASFSKAGASGKQLQEWYGDDPASPDFDDTGLSLGDIPHEISSTQFSIGLSVGYSF